MRELTVRIRFTKECLGDVKSTPSGHFVLPRDPQGRVTFLASWHRANLHLAARLLGRHQDEVAGVHWDISVDGVVQAGKWHKRYYRAGRRQRFVHHEAFFPGQVVGINCAVPAVISDEDFWRLMALAGRYRGLSPWKPGEYGFFEVESVRARRAAQEESCDATELVEGERQRDS